MVLSPVLIKFNNNNNIYIVRTMHHAVYCLTIENCTWDSHMQDLFFVERKLGNHYYYVWKSFSDFGSETKQKRIVIKTSNKGIGQARQYKMGMVLVWLKSHKTISKNKQLSISTLRLTTIRVKQSAFRNPRVSRKEWRERQTITGLCDSYLGNWLMTIYARVTILLKKLPLSLL